MDAGIWGIVAVLVIGTAVVAYGWLSDRATTRRQQDLLANPPDRTIPRFQPGEQRPRYLSELEAAVHPEGRPLAELDEATRSQLTARITATASVPAGWAASGFVTDEPSGWAVHEQPLVLVCADGLTTVRELLPALKLARDASRPLVVVAPQADAQVLGTLQANQVQGTLPCLLVLLPDRDQRRSLCSLTG
ncbi:MAG: hypothetical protein VB036_05770, partial [Propionicimonas sp.]|nr:hypothetical protein [Propionicimonas sp.]